MGLSLRAFLGVLTLTACSATRPQVTQRPPTCPAGVDAGDLFSREGVEGVFVLRDEATGCVQATDGAMADKGFRPQSTFKIPNALIGLETGVIEGGRHLWRWDGAPRRLHDWEQDLDLAGALRVSCVPCFQDAARRVGAERMSRYLGDFGNGNQDISGPIDQFWLDGQLRITPRGQVEFLHHMLAGELPVRRSNVELVWRLLEIESGPGFTFRGKTGLGSRDDRAIGWLVGYVEREGHRWIYATLVRGRADADVDAEMTRLMPVRRRITRALLARAHVLPGP